MLLSVCLEIFIFFFVINVTTDLTGEGLGELSPCLFFLLSPVAGLWSSDRPSAESFA